MKTTDPQAKGLLLGTHHPITPGILISSRKGKDTHWAGEAARKKAALLPYNYHTEIPGPRAMQTFSK